MARAGVYRTDVEKARRAVLARGKNPSIDQVRAELGNTGSRTTIHRFLKEIEAEEGEPQGAKPATSDVIQSLVTRLAEQLHQEANTLVDEHRTASEAKVREHADAAHAARQEAAATTARLEQVEAALAAERHAHAAAATQLQAARVQTAQLEERVAGQEQRRVELEAHLQSLEEKHQHARDALEHFRAQAQEQRAREQRQHEQALQALQVELRQAVDQATAKNAELLQLNRDNGRLLEQVTHQQQTLATAERELRAVRAELERLRPIPAQLRALEQSAAQTDAKAQALSQQLDQATHQRDRALEALRDAEMDRTRLAAKLEGMQAAWAAAEKAAPAEGSASQPSTPTKRRGAGGAPEASTT